MGTNSNQEGTITFTLTKPVLDKKKSASRELSSIMKNSI